MKQISQHILYESTPVNILGMKLSSNMVVLRHPQTGDLLLHSPIPCTPERREQINSLGRVSHLYAPNTFHHLWVGEWSQAFPDARVHAPSALVKKRPDLRIDRFHDQQSEPLFSSWLEEVPIRGFRMLETALVSQGVLVVTDLVQHVGKPRGVWENIYTRAMGFYNRAALSRVLRWTAFDNKSAARQSVDTLLSKPFEHLLVGHGEPILTTGKDAFALATDWLPVTPTRTLATRGEFFAKPCG